MDSRLCGTAAAAAAVVGAELSLSEAAVLIKRGALLRCCLVGLLHWDRRVLLVVVVERALHRAAAAAEDGRS